MILNNTFLYNTFNITSSSYWESRGKLIITWDDGKAGIYTNAFPIFVAKGVTATFYIVSDYVGTAGYVTWAQLREMAAAGMDIQCHTKDHGDLTTLSEAQTDANLQAVNAAFIANGLAAPSHTAYPGGQYNHTVKDYVANSRLTGRRTGYAEIFATSDRYGLGSKWIDNGYLNALTMPVIKGYIDTSNTNKSALCLYAHDCSVDGGELAISEANLAEIIDYALAVPVDVMSIKRLYSQMSHAAAPEAVVVPLTLTVNGDGIGIGALNIVSTEDMTISIDDGAARFYTNDLATLGESTSWDVLSGVNTVRYIRCPSGTSNLTFSKDTLTKFIWARNSGNEPKIGGDVTLFQYLIEQLTITGASLTEISINQLPRNVLSVNIRSGSLSGSLAALPYNITNFQSTTNTITGDVANLREGFQRIELGSANVVGGAVSDFPSTVNYIQITGNNVISGDMADAPAGVTRFDVYGQNRINAYTGGKAWSNDINYVRNMPATGYGLDVTELTNLISDLNGSVWGGSGRQLYVSGNNSSMANTTQGGIWGDFEGEATPSALAIAYKSLIKTKSVTVTLTGIAVPGASGDGTGFPAGFGDWYRS
jgi:hypothetical protein